MRQSLPYKPGTTIRPRPVDVFFRWTVGSSENIDYPEKAAHGGRGGVLKHLLGRKALSGFGGFTVARREMDVSGENGKHRVAVLVHDAAELAVFLALLLLAEHPALVPEV